MKSKAKENVKRKKNTALHLMLFPGMIILFIYSYLPMFGLVMAFQNFRPARGILGSDWVGLDNFRAVLAFPDIGQIIFNTVYISLIKIILNLLVPIIIALLINEVRKKWFVKSIQTMIYLPFFISWAILGGIFIDLLSPSVGIINRVISIFGVEPIFFLGSNEWFRPTLFATDVWRNFGYNSIIFFAALTGIDETLYEAASIDGANRWKQTLHVTIPGMVPIILIMTVLSLGNILNAGFDQIYNLYNPAVLRTGDIIDTFVFRLGFEQAQFSFSTAVGLFQSVIGMVMKALAFWFLHKFTNYRIF